MKAASTVRRRFLGLVGTLAATGMAGCAGAPEAGETPTPNGEPGGDDHEEGRPEGVPAEQFESGPVPEPYRTADSQAGEPRILDELQSKEAVRFQEAAEAVEAGLATEDHNCGNCAEFIPDRNGDGFGACAKVEGYVGAEDWCVLWESLDEELAEDDEDDAES